MKAHRIIFLLITILLILPSFSTARYYDPQTGRYLTPDPIGLEGGINPYGYIENDPVNHVDPLGLETRIVIGNDYLPANWLPLVRTGHTGLWVERSGNGPGLYDPSGSYYRTLLNTDLYSPGPAYQGMGSEWNRYLGYQTGIGTNERYGVEVFIFDTSEEEEMAIFKRADMLGEESGSHCAEYVSSAISGIGPFMSIQPTRFPGQLGDQLRKLPMRHMWRIPISH